MRLTVSSLQSSDGLHSGLAAVHHRAVSNRQVVTGGRLNGSGRRLGSWAALILPLLTAFGCSPTLEGPRGSPQEEWRLLCGFFESAPCCPKTLGRTIPVPTEFVAALRRLAAKKPLFSRQEWFFPQRSTIDDLALKNDIPAPIIGVPCPGVLLIPSQLTGEACRPEFRQHFEVSRVGFNEALDEALYYVDEQSPLAPWLSSRDRGSFVLYRKNGSVWMHAASFAVPH